MLQGAASFQQVATPTKGWWICSGAEAHGIVVRAVRRALRALRHMTAGQLFACRRPALPYFPRSGPLPAPRPAHHWRPGNDHGPSIAAVAPQLTPSVPGCLPPSAGRLIGRRLSFQFMAERRRLTLRSIRGLTSSQHCGGPATDWVCTAVKRRKSPALAQTRRDSRSRRGVGTSQPTRTNREALPMSLPYRFMIVRDPVRAGRHEPRNLDGHLPDRGLQLRADPRPHQSGRAGRRCCSSASTTAATPSPPAGRWPSAFPGRACSARSCFILGILGAVTRNPALDLVVIPGSLLTLAVDADLRWTVVAGVARGRPEPSYRCPKRTFRASSSLTMSRCDRRPSAPRPRWTAGRAAMRSCHFSTFGNSAMSMSRLVQFLDPAEDRDVGDGIVTGDPVAGRQAAR